MRVLGLETSCDETAAAVVERAAADQRVGIISAALASSEDLQRKYGGVVPEAAARRQVESIVPVIRESLEPLGGQGAIDAIAVVVGPGLIGSLLVGVETARVLASSWNKPLIPVNHLMAHLYANWVDTKSKVKSQKSKVQGINLPVPRFPAVGLVASGGHTDLVLMHSHGNLRYLGGTRDDAAGEAFDKIARLLGLGYPGGPAIAAAAEKSEIRNPKSDIHLPRPMIDSEDYDVSFSGLKTAVLRIMENADKEEAFVKVLAFGVQEAIVEVLVAKARRAVEEFRPRAVLLGGGVAANLRLRRKLELLISNFQFPITLYLPPAALCTDNAVMAAAAGCYHPSPTPWQAVRADPGLSIVG